MSDLNSISLTGRAGRDAELRQLENGNKVTNFSLAVSQRPTRTNPKPDAEWFDINLWGNSAEVAAQFVKKGGQVGITGRLSLERWTDRSTGEERVKLAVNADSLTLLGGKPMAPDYSDAQGSPEAPERQPAQRANTPSRPAAAGTRRPAGRPAVQTSSNEAEIPF